MSTIWTSLAVDWKVDMNRTELFILLAGSIEFTLRGKATTIHAGHVVNIPANAPHFFTNTTDQTARVLCVCTPAAQEEFFAEAGQILPTRTSAPVPHGRTELLT